jgi:hypothetical protein
VPGICFSSRRALFDTISVGSLTSVSCDEVAPGICFSSRRAMFDTISVGSLTSVSCDEGLCDMSHYKLLCMCSQRNHMLRLRGSHLCGDGSAVGRAVVVINT